jgi:hypothetical protein
MILRIEDLTSDLLKQSVFQQELLLLCFHIKVQEIFFSRPSLSQAGRSEWSMKDDVVVTYSQGSCRK